MGKFAVFAVASLFLFDSVVLSPFWVFFFFFFDLSYVPKEIMKKNGKKVPKEVSTSPFPLVGEDDRARLKFLILLQDYEELLKDTKTERMRLHKAEEVKSRLSAEVRFLKKKYRQFTRTPPRGTPYRLKKNKPNEAPSQPRRPIMPSSTSLRSLEPIRDGNCGVAGAEKHKTSVMFDLNLAFIPSAEEIEELQLETEPVRMEKPRRSLEDGRRDMATSNLTLSTCRGVGATISAKRVGKRKYLWQDQLALKV